MSGTGTAHGGTSLCAYYAVSGTDTACGVISLRACYAMSGTEIAYGAAETLANTVAGLNRLPITAYM
eukprot:3556346-Rhodomonas_salina.1